MQAEPADEPYAHVSSAAVPLEHADLQEGITMILEEMRAMRSISSQAEGGEGVSEETDDPEPNADGVERASVEKMEDVDQLLRDIRSAVSQTP